MNTFTIPASMVTRLTVGRECIDRIADNIYWARPDQDRELSEQEFRDRLAEVASRGALNVCGIEILLREGA